MAAYSDDAANAGSDVRVKEVGGRAGWYVDQLTLELSSGCNSHGGNGGEALRSTRLAPGEYLTSVKQFEGPYLAAFDFSVNTGRTIHIRGSKQCGPGAVEFVAPTGQAIIGLTFQSEKLMGISTAPKPSAEVRGMPGR